MSYTIEEVSNKLIDTEGKEHLSFFYKFKLKPKEEFASIELNPYIDEDKARLMAANIIAEKIAKRLTYEATDDGVRRTVLSFSGRHIELEEREINEQYKNQLLNMISVQKKQLEFKEDELELKTTENNILKRLIASMAGLSISLLAINIYQFFN